MTDERPTSGALSEPAIQIKSESQSLQTSSIDKSMLENGSQMLCRRGRKRDTQKEYARIITMVWGERYVSDLLSVTIPAMLAQGNLPAFAESFQSELVIVTERRFFNIFSVSPVIDRALNHCNVRLVPIDDLLSSWYGITLTYALVRGFADLGSAMIDTHLIFINADFILADGSYRKLAEMIARGERLVVSPSYCMVLEDTIDELRARYDPVTCALSIAPREMASMIINHRHNTIRAKTINQRLFRIHRYDQFYWHVDEHTMLAHQLPIAVVYMRPERVLTEMPTFWDYGVISEFCPTVTPCVLGDSDDFLYGELRTEGTFRDLLHLGWPSVEEIAKDLSTFTTQDHRVYGRFQLVLHSADLPGNLDEDRRKLQAFVDSVYERLDPPISYRDHVFWASAYPRFVSQHVEQAAKLQSILQIEENVRKDAGGSPVRDMMLLESRLLELEMHRTTLELSGLAELRLLEIELVRIEVDHRKEREPIEQKMAHHRRTQLELTAQVERKILETSSELTLVMTRGHKPSLYDRGKIEAPVSSVKIPAAPAKPPNKIGIPTALDLLGKLYQFAFGRLVTTTRWHPFHLILKRLLSAIAEGLPSQNALIISSGGPLSTALPRSIVGKKVTLTPKMLTTTQYGGSSSESGRFDLCLFDLSAADLLEFRAMFVRVRKMLAPRARVIAFYFNYEGRDIDQNTFEYTRRLFPLTGKSQVTYSGSLAGSLAMRWFLRGLNHNDLSRFTGRLKFAATLAFCGPLARLAYYLEAKRPPENYPKHCTSMTMKIDLA